MKIRTYEKKAHVKNGIARLFFSVLAIALEIAFIVVVFTRLNDYAEGINIATRILAVVLVVCIYAQDRTSSMKTPWIMLILAFPIFGIIMYLLVGLKVTPIRCGSVTMPWMPSFFPCWIRDRGQTM